MNKNALIKVIIVGKLPPPYFGPAIATEIILNSDLNKHYNLLHLDTRLNDDMQTMGKLSFNKIVKTFSIYSNYLKLLKQNNVKIVLIPIAQETFGLLKDSVLIILGRLYKKKIIIHLRGSSLLTWYQSRNFILQAYIKSKLSKADSAIVLGESLRYIFQPFLATDKIFVVPNGANISFPKKEPSSSKVNLLYFANLMANKGADLLLNALKDLPKEITMQVSCTVTGRWKNEEFRRLCFDIVNHNNLPVLFESPKSGVDKFKQFINADIFIFPPRAPEGHPWVIVEAMAAGLPIITTDQGAIKECVIHGENGFIVETNSHEGIKQKIIELVTNPEIRKKMANQSRLLYEERYTEDKMIENLKSVFDITLARS
ncbi:MAG: glycosyltransferase family 4 protein [Bacteroidia bacterium]